MKIANAKIESYLKNIAKEKIAGCLIYGPEISVANHRFDEVAKQISPDLSDPFLVSNISKDRLSKDKALLGDEFYSLSMLGGRKLILIKESDASVTEGLKMLFADGDFAEKSENFILIQAGDLAKSSALRKLAEDSPGFAAIPCYEDNEGFIRTFINDYLRQQEIKSDPKITEYLLEKFGRNRQVILAELEKISIYLGENKELSLELVDKLTMSQAEISSNEFIANFTSKKFDIALLQANRLLKEGFETITLIRFLSNYLQKLYHAKMQITSNSMTFDEAVRAQRLFFKVEMQFKKDLQNSSLPFLVQNLDFLEKLELKIKTSNMSPKLLFTSFIHGMLKKNKINS